MATIHLTSATGRAWGPRTLWSGGIAPGAGGDIFLEPAGPSPRATTGGSVSTHEGRAQPSTYPIRHLATSRQPLRI